MAAPLIAGVGLLSFAQKRAAGKITQLESETAAKQEDLAATQREVERKQRLAEALASQNAQAGAGGIAAFEGSPLTILQEDIRKADVAGERAGLESRLKVTSRLARGKIARKQANLSATVGLLKAGASAAQVGE